MPPKDPIDLGLGTLYIAQEGEAPVPLGEGIQEITEEMLEPAEYIFDKELAKMGEAASILAHADFTLVIEAFNTTWNTLKNMYNALQTLFERISTCRNGRVRYLAGHAKKKKDRIKNMKRLLRGD